MTPLPRRTLVETRMGCVHVRAVGDHTGSDPAVLLLHQSPLSSRMWEYVMPLLAPLPVVAPDLFDHGDSDPAPRPLGLAEHAELLVEAAEAVAPGPKILVGNHVGAVLAAQIAATRGELTVGLVVIGYPLYHDWRDRYARFVHLRPIDIDPDGEELLELWRATSRAFVDEVPSEARLTELADRLRCGRVWYQTYVSVFTTDLRELLVSAARTRLPALILAPEHDTLAAYVEDVAAVLGAPVVPLPGGVRTTWEHPAAVADQVRRFAADILHPTGKTGVRSYTVN